jgi:hypothetical protein
MLEFLLLSCAKVNSLLRSGRDRADVCPCRWLFLGRGVFGVFSTDVIVKHFAQNLFSFEGVACEVEFNGATNRAGTIKEIIFRLGVYDQFRFVHRTMMPQPETLKRGWGISN